MSLPERLTRFFPRSHRFVSLLGPQGLRVVLYHHITDRLSPLYDRLNIATPVATFRAHLEYFRREYKSVGLDEVLTGRLPEKALLITFDDAYRSVYTTAAPILKEFGFPGVFFVSSGFVGNRRLMLDNLLCYLSHKVSLNELAHSLSGKKMKVRSLADLIGRILPEISYERRLDARQQLAGRYAVDEKALLEEADLYLHREDLPHLCDYGLEIGNHTKNHVHCRILAAGNRMDEILGAQSDLERGCGCKVRAFSFPYGHREDATPEMRTYLRDTGHEISFLVEARTNASRISEEPLYRVSLQEHDISGVFARLEVLPRCRTLVDSARKKWRSG